MKADNEPAISIPVYFKSVKKWKYVLQNNNNNNKKQKDPKKKRKKVSIVENQTPSPSQKASKVLRLLS